MIQVCSNAHLVDNCWRMGTQIPFSIGDRNGILRQIRILGSKKSPDVSKTDTFSGLLESEQSFTKIQSYLMTSQKYDETNKII